VAGEDERVPGLGLCRSCGLSVLFLSIFHLPSQVRGRAGARGAVFVWAFFAVKVVAAILLWEYATDLRWVALVLILIAAFAVGWGLRKEAHAHGEE
jgi:hypothetical protein